MNDVLYIGWTPPTPLGIIWVAANETGLVAVSLGDELEIFNAELAAQRPRAQITPDEGRTHLFTSQIAAYLTGERTEFDLPIDWSMMTPFSKKRYKPLSKFRAVRRVPMARLQHWQVHRAQPAPWVAPRPRIPSH